MLTVYCIPGMGVDARLFKNLELNNCKIQHIKWLTPYKNETLPQYAIRLSEQINTSEPFAIVGVSFGGMCAVEIARHLNPIKTFLVSSCKLKSEVPQKIKIWKYVPLYKSISDKTYKKAALVLKKQFGVTNADQEQKFRDMLESAPVGYFKGAVHCIMSWKERAIPNSVVQIHGTKDLVLPIKRIKKCDYIIEGGSHFMIINKATEINAIINAELGKVYK